MNLPLLRIVGLMSLTAIFGGGLSLFGLTIPKSASKSTPQSVGEWISKPILEPTLRPEEEEPTERPSPEPQKRLVPVLDLPTDNHLLFDKEGVKDFFQPTFSGRLISAMFGCVRNPGANGKFRRFHEGIDIRPLEYDRRGEPLDAVRSAGDGRIVHLCGTTGGSNYGKYIVVQHEFAGVVFFTLYAHLASIEKGVVVGKEVRRGERIGVLGRTSNEFDIHQEFAHLHFEVDLMINTRYVEWSRRQGEGDPQHGIYNGGNLIGIDPVRFYQFLQINPDSGVGEFISREKVGFKVVVPYKKSFSWIRDYEFCLTGPVTEQTEALEISMTYYGLPIRIEPLSMDRLDSNLQKSLRKGIYPLTFASGPELRTNEGCQHLLDRKGPYWGITQLGKKWIDLLIY